MKQRIEVRSQAELDAVIASGNIAVIVGFRAIVSGSAEVEAWGNSSVVAWGNSSVVAWGNSSVVAWGNSSVEAWENSSVEAWGNSSVEARGNVFVRLFAAVKIKASAYVTIVKHGNAKHIEGGRQLDAAPEPASGAKWCDFNGIDPATAPFVVPDLDAKILAHVEAHNHFDMSTWHGRKCDETDWCETTHCRAGFAICLAGAAGFDLEKKYGPELAGRMIYAASCPNDPLPCFTATNDEALEDMRRRAGATT